MNTKSIQNNIMRRVYYACIIRSVTHPIMGYMLALGVLGWYLKELVFVARIWESFISTPVGELGGFFVSLFWHADMLTVLVFGVLLVVFIQLTRTLIRIRTQNMFVTL